MSELTSVRRYMYWSDRRIRRIAEDNDIRLDRKAAWSISTPPLPFLPQVAASGERRNLSRHAIAVRMEESIGIHAVSDFVTPPKVAFAKGCGDVTFASYTAWYGRPKKKAALLHTRTVSSDGSLVDVTLFGSMENCADYLADSKPEAPTWSSSSTRDIERFIASQGTRNDSQYDDDESIAVEIVRTINTQGMANKYVFEHAKSVEWFAQIYHDVQLTRDRWQFSPGSADMPEPTDRIVIGAPLWVRTT
jgi:hypothetical protein